LFVDQLHLVAVPFIAVEISAVTAAYSMHET